MKNISNQTKRELKESGIAVVKINWFNHHHRIDKFIEASNRIQCVQAVHTAIRGILELIHHDDGTYLQADKGKKIPLKVTKEGRLYSKFEEQFKFHFQFLLDMVLEHYNQDGIKLKNPRFYVDTLATQLTDNAVIKVRVHYANSDGGKYIDFRFTLENPYNSDGRYDAETINCIYPDKYEIAVLRKIKEADSIQNQIRDLLQKHDKITTELGQYADVREVPRFR